MLVDKVDISRILIDHFKTLKDYSTDRYSRADFVLFLGGPAAVAALLLAFYGKLGSSLVTVFVTSLSIFAALLFNLLLLVYDAMRKAESEDAGPAGLRGKFLRQIASNISFAILVAVVAIVSVLVLMFVGRIPNAVSVVSGLVYFLVTLFMLTLLMVLKRVHILLYTESDSS